MPRGTYRRIGINIQTSFQNDLEISFNPTLIDILLSNLISNSIKHNPKHGVVTITISGREWTIANPGNPSIISPDKIYDRFQKGDTNQTSTGLGLAIVKKICDTSGIAIQYKFKNDVHLFSVNF